MSRFAVAVLIVSVLGCQSKTPEQQVEDFKVQVGKVFANRNTEAAVEVSNLRSEIAEVENNPSLPAPAGAVLSFFDFHPDGMVLFDVECGACRTRHNVVNYTGQDLFCPRCGGVTKPGQAKEQRVRLVVSGLRMEQLESQYPGAKKMFELTQQGPDQPLKAVVRYVRRTRTYDSLGAVQVADSVISGREEFTKLPGLGGDKGFHRPQEAFIGTVEYEYSGGVARETGKETETAVRPWKSMRRPQSN